MNVLSYVQSFFTAFVKKIGIITKTCLYNFDPLQPHSYVVKLEFAGVYIICFISAQNIDCGFSLEPPRQGGSNEYPQSIVDMKTYPFKYTENLPPKNEKFKIKISNIFHSSAQNIDCGFHVYYVQNLCFWAEIRKIMYTHVNPRFTK